LRRKNRNMKKLLVLSVLLGLMALPVFTSDVTIGGDVQFFANGDQDDTDLPANMGKLRVRIDAAVDDYNTAKLEFRNDGATTLTGANLAWKYAYLKSDISGALGLDAVGITARFGIFDEWHALWNAATSSHRARALNDDWGMGNADIVGAALDFGLGPVALKTYVEFGDGTYAGDFLTGYKFALASENTLLDGLKFIVGYVGYANSSARKGFIHGDAGYSLSLGDLSLTVPLSFVYDMEDSAIGYGTGVKVGYSMFGVNVGLGTGEQGDVSTDFLEVLDAEVMVMPIENATIYAKIYNRIAEGGSGEATGFQALDFGGKYAFGAMTFYLGYVYASEDTFSTNVTDDDSASRQGVTGSGFYLAAKLGF